MGEYIFLRRQDALRQKLSEQNLDGILIYAISVVLQVQQPPV